MPAYERDEVEKSERRQTLIASGFLVLAILVAHIPATAQQVLADALKTTVLRPFVATQNAVTRARTLAVETESLRAQLDSVASILSATAAMAEENQQLRELLELKERLGPAFRAAGAVRSGTSGAESVLLLDLGAQDGVVPGAPVVVLEGLVGKVTHVATRESVAMDWSHPDFRASAMTEDGGTFGIVEARRGAFREADRLLMNGIPFYTELGPGTRVVTSGLGGVFPRGVAIGTVEERAEAEARWRKSYWLRPAVRPGSVTHVLVRVTGAGAAPTDLSWAFEPGAMGAVRTPADTSGPAPQEPPPSGPEADAPTGATRR